LSRIDSRVSPHDLLIGLGREDLSPLGS
jgi:hypothetical protein